MSTCSDPHPLRRDGLSQSQRQLPALDPTHVQLDERTGDDLLAFAASYAQKVGLRFYPLDGPAAAPPAGSTTLPTWASLMQLPAGQSRADLEARSDNPPHLALFLAFLKLFGWAQEQLNAFTQRHLDYYYREVLRLDGRSAVADQVHLTFELARNVAEQVLPAGTEFEADSDDAEIPLRYRAAAERVLNRAGLTHLRALYLEDKPDQPVYFAPDPATADGVAAPLPDNDPSWSAFGGAAATQAWPIANLGFALASPVLLLAEGTRRITVTLTAQRALKLPSNPRLHVQLSGATAWLEPVAQPQLVRRKGTNEYQFVVTLPASEKQAVVGYDATRLDGGYVTTAPVLRVLLADTKDYQLLRDLALDAVSIEVSVTGLHQTLKLENDLGPVNPDKPFLAFGAVPTAGSRLYIDCPEAAGKALASLKVTVPAWLGKPGAWDTYYKQYNLKEADLKATVTVRNQTLNLGPQPVPLFSSFTQGLELRRDPAALAVAMPLVARALASEFGRYERLGSDFVEASPLRDLAAAAAPASNERLLTIELQQELGHRDYASLLTKAITSKSTSTTPLAPDVPNAPYAPLAQSLQLDYTASTGSVVFSGQVTAEAFAQRAVRLFHQAPFGQAEEHVRLKQRLLWLTASGTGAAAAAAGTTYLLPRLAAGGTLLLGLREAGPRQTVAVLFQVAEGSANPLREPAQVAWSVLSQNQWRPLSNEYAPLDRTDNLLTSGIIEFQLPPETRLDNTLLESGLVWLKGELQTPDGQPAPPDSVARLVAVHPQAQLARLAEPAADPAHYTTPLPAGTLTRVRQGSAGVQTVRQPYPSFGGQPAETDAAFYTRVSERLRHKQRAVTIWDYEHLVLQQFPDLYKVQCLSHTRVSEVGSLREHAPGYVTLVVVPNLRHAYAANPLEPRVALRTLKAIQAFAQAHAGLLVDIQVINPTYQPVEVGGKIAFRPGYPAATYQARLNQDLRTYLAPWATATTAELSFGGALRKSTVLAFIEQLPYVDFITDLTLRVAGGSDQETIEAASPQVVLGSAPTHAFTEIPPRVLSVTR
jgi:hypothetical protein